MIIIEDKGQKEEKHELKHLFWKDQGISWERYSLPVGDYILGSPSVMDVIARKQKRGIDVKKMDFLGAYELCIDTKKDMQEIVGNICGKQHERFRDECILAKNNGIKLYVLVENQDGIRNIGDVAFWKNPRLTRYEKIKEMHLIGKWKSVPEPKSPPTSGETLAKAMRTMQEKYGVHWCFASPEEAGIKIIELLGGIADES